MRRWPSFAVAAALGLIVGGAHAAPAPGAAPAASFELWPSALVQTDWVVHRQSSEDQLDPSGEPLNRDRFLLRRGRVGLDAGQSAFTARLELEASTQIEPTLRAFEAIASVRWPARAEIEVPRTGPYGDTPRKADGRGLLMLSAGLFRVPFGVDASEPSTDSFLLERTTASRALFAEARDLGLGLDAEYGPLRLAAAFQNGEPLGSGAFGLRDPSSGKDFSARAGVAVPIVEKVELSAGVSWLAGRGFSPGTPGTKDTLGWSDGNEDGQVSLSELFVVPGVPARESESFDRGALGADLGVDADLPLLGRLRVRGEVVRASNLDRTVLVADPTTAGRDLRELAWYVLVAQELTEHATLGVRYDVYEPDADGRRRAGVPLVPSEPRYTTLAVALGARIEMFRLTFEYDQNGNLLGRDPSGAPTRLKDDVFGARWEMRIR